MENAAGDKNPPNKDDSAKTDNAAKAAKSSTIFTADLQPIIDKLKGLNDKFPETDDWQNVKPTLRYAVDYLEFIVKKDAEFAGGQ